MRVQQRGTSSVVGVLLLVAVTVVVAGVLSVFALQLGESVRNPAPQTQFEVETCTMCGSLADPGDTTNFLNITFTHGDPLNAD